MKPTYSWIVVIFVLALLNDIALAQGDFFDEANQRIEQHRKADIVVSVVDINNIPVSNATIDLQMTRHQFRWGTAVVANRINSNSSTNQTYRQKLSENFNSIVFENDLKWPAWEGVWGPNLGWGHAEPALDWLESNDFEFRGHYISWGTLSGVDGFGPNNSNTASIPGLLFPHITDKLQTVGDRITEWDVINHPVGWGPTTYEDLFGTAFYAAIVDYARNEAPAGASLWMNEDNILNGGNVADQYEQILNFLANNKSDIDGIGFQGHFKSSWGRNLPDTPQRMYAQMERFASLVPHLQLTEFDIDVGEFDSNGNLLNYDQQEHAQLMTNYLISAFSHENLEGITMWGFWEGSHWLPTAALYNLDWSERPALQAYRDLVFDAWWTNENGLTDAAGQYSTRGFKGKYLVTVEVNGQTFEQTFDTNQGMIEFKVPSVDENISPGSMNIIRGSLVSGDVQSLDASDDEYVVLRSTEKVQPGSEAVWVEFEATAMTVNPAGIQITFEDRANTPGIETIIEIWNWNSNVYQEPNQIQTSYSQDQVTTVNVGGFIPSYVNSADGRIRSRIGWKKTGVTLFNPWDVRLDQLKWIIEE